MLLLGAYFTYRQLHTSREGQVTERFTRAIDQLGHTEPDVRIGGIYALERIANDSPDDRTTIVEVLTAFVRGHAPWPPRLPGQYLAAAAIEQIPELQLRAPDVQAALTVLARRQPPPKPSEDLDLHATDLRKANLNGANLKGADLDGANLQEAYLGDADLQGTRFFGANLQGALLFTANLEETFLHDVNLQGAVLKDANLKGARTLHDVNLQGADLSGANLQGAGLEGADLQGAHLVDANLKNASLAYAPGAILINANLQGAHLRRAQLQGADLRGAQLQGADLCGAQLQGASLFGANLQRANFGDQFENALADLKTIWPEGFDAGQAGVVLIDRWAETADEPES